MFWIEKTLILKQDIPGYQGGVIEQLTDRHGLFLSFLPELLDTFSHLSTTGTVHVATKRCIPTEPWSQQFGDVLEADYWRKGGCASCPGLRAHQMAQICSVYGGVCGNSCSYQQLRKWKSLKVFIRKVHPG